MHKKALILILSAIITSNGFTQSEEKIKPRGPYLGQITPGTSSELFAPGIVSTGMSELNSVFAPDGKAFFFCVRTFQTSSAFVMKEESGVWSTPGLLPFASRYGDIDVSLSPDGSMLFFCSKRILNPADTAKKDYDIWMSKNNDGSWSEPVNMGSEVNSHHDDFYPTMARNGNLYFNSQREKEGTNNIYFSKNVDGVYAPAEKLGPEINIGTWNFDAFIDPDEQYLILSSNAQGGYGGSDLYISFRSSDVSWTRAINLGSRVNTNGWDLCPAVTPDGKYLFFTSSGSGSATVSEKPMNYSQYLEALNKPGNGSTDIWWVDAKVIYDLMPAK